MKSQIFIGVLGGRSVSDEIYAIAFDVGMEIAAKKAVLVCGGLTGVMTAVAEGAKSAGGTTIGILPSNNADDANQYIDYPIPTGFGLARNMIIINTSDVLIAIDGEYGTLSEITFALNSGKQVVTLLSKWDFPETVKANNPRQAVELALELLAKAGEAPDG